MKRRYVLSGNPCKYCLTRPVCNQTCDDFENYGCTVHDFTFYSYLFGIAILFVVILFGLYHTLPWWQVAPIFGFSVLIFGYIKTIVEIKKDENSEEWKEMKKWQRGLICVLGPILMFGSYTWDKMPVDKPIDDFIYKYIKKLQPNREY